MLTKRLFFLFWISFFSNPVYGIFDYFRLGLAVVFDPLKKEDVDINSRKYLYEILKNSPDFILTNHVKKNREYYIKLIEQHLRKLEQKKSIIYPSQFKKLAKVMPYLCATVGSIAVCEWCNERMLTLNKIIDTNKINMNDRNRMVGEFNYRAELAVLSFLFSLPCAYQTIKKLYKTIKFSNQLEERMHRDIHILKLLKQS